MTRRRQTFADIVRAAASVPPPPPPVLRPGFTADGDLVGQDGRRYRRVAEVTGPRVLALAREGAVVVVDPCGCEGYCGLTWVAADVVATLAHQGRVPRIRRTRSRRGSASEWRDDAGAPLVLLEDAVEWGDALG